MSPRRISNDARSTATVTYDEQSERNSSRLYKDNLVVSGLAELYHASSTTSGDNATAYDGLNRVVGFVRGALSSSGHNGSSLDMVATPSTQPSHAESWSLDTLGNWSSQSIDGTSTSRTHDSKNQLTVVGTHNLTFDHNGNTTTDERGYSYTYNAWNRLLTVTNATPTLVATYAYDAKGQRIKTNANSVTTDLAVRRLDCGWKPEP